MVHRKASILLIVFSLIGGLIGFAVGEAVLSKWEGSMPNWLLMGVYFGQLALFVGLMCLIAEHVSPVLNGKGWRLRYAKDGWKLLVPGTLLLLFVAGGIGQFLYGLYFGKHKPPQNILLSIDVSESMAEKDPDRESFRAAKDLVRNMERGKRVAVMTFNDRAELVQPLAPVDNAAAKDAVIAKLDEYGQPSGGTNIAAALAKAMEQIEAVQAEARGSMVILISDGYSDVNLNSALMSYRNNDIAVNTVGVNALDRQGNELLQRIAADTGGTYHSVEDIQHLSAVFDKIYKANQGWHLVGERTGSAVNSLFYAVWRILFVMLLGLLMGLSLGIVFDNRFLARSFSVGGAIAGLLAGFILEEGLKGGALPAETVRASADIVLAVVLAISTLLVPFRENRTDEAGQGLYKRSRSGSGTAFGENGPTGRKFR